MEQQAFYIVFAIVGMAIVGIVFWAATYSSRNDYDDYYRGRGGYPPPYPQYPPPYYPQPYPPRQESSIFTILALGLVIFLLFAGMQYCGRMEELNIREQNTQNDDIATENIATASNDEEPGGEKMPEGREEFRPREYAVINSNTAVDTAAPAIDPQYGYFVQTGASSDGQSTLEDAKALFRTYPNLVFIGENINDGTGHPYKLLIGPYATEEEAKSGHGWDAIVYRPVDKHVQLYHPR